MATENAKAREQPASFPQRPAAQEWAGSHFSEGTSNIFRCKVFCMSALQFSNILLRGNNFLVQCGKILENMH
jgi:hypothetical protein